MDGLKRRRWRKMRHTKWIMKLWLIIWKSMKMENHPNFNFLFVIVKLNHSFCYQFRFLLSAKVRLTPRARRRRGRAKRISADLPLQLIDMNRFKWIFYTIAVLSSNQLSLFNFIIQPFHWNEYRRLSYLHADTPEICVEREKMKKGKMNNNNNNMMMRGTNNQHKRAEYK